MLPKLSESTQTISFSEADGLSSSELYAKDVVVTTNAGSHNHGSSMVKLKNLVDYNWEPKMYSGRLLALHISGLYLAYSIKAPNVHNPGTWNGMVRVVYNPDPGNDKRALIEGMKGEVQDLSFAHIQNEVILGCIDEQGHIYIHEVEIIDNAIRCTLLLKVLEDTNPSNSVPHRIIWCPYMPDEDDVRDDDVAKLMLTTHSDAARMWNISKILQDMGECPAPQTVSALACSKGVMYAEERAGVVVDAAFSPDGTALATASVDGYVMFFQVYMHNEAQPRCLHKWQPHDGKPISSLFFLDNHKNYNPEEQFWKFAVTGAENNSVFKIWSCKSWTCLQTITFAAEIPTEPNFGLKAALDKSATYLLVSDFKARTQYVMHIAKDANETMSYCKSISEFLLPYPVLSFCIADAVEEPSKCASACDLPFHRSGSADDVRTSSPNPFSPHPLDDAEEAGGACAGLVRLALFVVQPKGLQSAELDYLPPQPLQHAVHDNDDLSLLDDSVCETRPALSASILQQQSQQLKSLLLRTQVSLSTTQPGGMIGQRSDSPPMPSLDLMTPDAFGSPGKRDEDDPPLSATPDVAIIARTSTGGVVSTEGKSGGSSPSREVEQMVSPLQPHRDYSDARSEEVSESPQPETAPANQSAELFVRGDIDAVTESTSKLSIHSNKETVWPQFSYAQIHEANQRKASSDNQSVNQSVSQTGIQPSDLTLNESAEIKMTSTLSAEDRSRLESLEKKIDALTELVTQQNRQIRTLRETNVDPTAVLQQAITKHTRLATEQLNEAFNARWDELLSAAGNAGEAAGRGAARALEPLAKALQHELATKMSATDTLLRDNINKMVNSKSVLEQLSNAVSTSLAGMVRNSFREALIHNVMPALEKAHNQLFKQINQTFQAGTKEFAAATEAAARAAAARGGAAGAESLRTALEAHSGSLAAQPAPAHTAALIRDVTGSVLEKELAAWREQARSVVAEVSRAQTPATPGMDRQVQIHQVQAMISTGDINGAFQLALSAADLSLVVAACRSLSPHAVFTQPPRLKHHVVLSLIQQLAADLHHDTQLKHRYLEEAITGLDANNPVIREHMPTVLREVQKQIVPFLASNPDHPLRSQFRMLLLATESLAKSVV